MLKVLLTGGGTAGHVNPALAIMDIIKSNRPDAEFLYVGTPNSLEARITEKVGVPFASIEVMGIQRRLSVKNMVRNAKAAGYLITSGPKAKKILNDFEPDLVIGTGGYVSGPVVMAAVKKKIPTVIHEPNAFPGVTTKILAPKVNRVTLAVEVAKNRLDPAAKCRVTGLPVRAAIGKISKSEARAKLGLDNSFTLLSVGGSLGAGGINRAATDLIAWHRLKGMPINHIHGYGGMGKDSFLDGLKGLGIDIEDKRLILQEYVDMALCMAAADLVICRCGASTLSELQSLGKPSILIPSPVVTENHQYHNAMVLARAGAAVVIEEKNMTAELIVNTVESFMNDPVKLRNYAAKAASMAVADVDVRMWKVIEGVLRSRNNASH